VTMTFSTSTLKPRTLNGAPDPGADRAALALDALAATEPAPAPVPASAPAVVEPRRRKVRAVAAAPVTEPASMSTPVRLDEPSDLEVLGEVALAAHAQGLTLHEYIVRVSNQLDVVRRLLGARR